VASTAASMLCRLGPWQSGLSKKPFFDLRKLSRKRTRPFLFAFKGCWSIAFLGGGYGHPYEHEKNNGNGCEFLGSYTPSA
jgi:hypothetical protein